MNTNGTLIIFLVLAISLILIAIYLLVQNEKLKREILLTMLKNQLFILRILNIVKKRKQSIKK